MAKSGQITQSMKCCVPSTRPEFKSQNTCETVRHVGPSLWSWCQGQGIDGPNWSTNLAYIIGSPPPKMGGKHLRHNIKGLLWSLHTCGVWLRKVSDRQHLAEVWRVQTAICNRSKDADYRTSHSKFQTLA